MRGGKPTLISTLHDPDGRMLEPLTQCIDLFKSIYGELIVVSTPESSSELAKLLTAHRAHVRPNGSACIGESRRRAVIFGLQTTSAARLHYCDFDRLLHWALHYSHELERVVTHELGRFDFL